MRYINQQDYQHGEKGYGDELMLRARHCLARPSASGSQLKVSAEAVASSQGLTGEASATKLMWLLAEFHFLQVVGLVGCWPKVALASLPHGPHNIEVSSQYRSQKEGKSVGKKGLPVFGNMVLEVTFHHLRHILLVRSKSQVLPKRDIKTLKGVSIRRWGYEWVI